MSALEAEATELTDETAVAACAEVGNACIEDEGDALVCIADYTSCVVAAGVPADHPFLICLGELVTCWSGVEGDDAALDTCFHGYDDCLAAVLPEPRPEPPPEPEVPSPPSTPGEEALWACADAAEACFERVGERGYDEVSCTADYRSCILEAGVSPEEPYVGCLDELIVCFDGESSARSDHGASCWDSFERCVETAYPHEPPPDHAPPSPDTELYPCEEPVLRCYEEGGSESECIAIYRSCLIDEGWSPDAAPILCLDDLIACADSAEASADPDSALADCAHEFDQCLYRAGY